LEVLRIALYEDERTARQKQFASRGRTFTTTAFTTTATVVSVVVPTEEQEHSPGRTSVDFGSDNEETKSRTHTYVQEEGEKEEGTWCDETRTPVNLDSQSCRSLVMHESTEDISSVRDANVVRPPLLSKHETSDDNTQNS
jgi:hypothetical protein